MAWWAGVGWGVSNRQRGVEVDEKRRQGCSYKTKGANCQGGSPGCVFFGPVRRPVLVGMGEGVAVRRARRTWKYAGWQRMGARTRKENQMGKWATGDGEKAARTQIQINFSHEERRLSQTGLSRLHQAALLHSAGAERGKTRRGTPKESLCPPNSHGLGPVGTRDGRAKRGPGGGQKGAKEASHGSRLRSFLRILTTDHSDARSGFSPPRETRPLLHLCLGQEAQPIGSWLRRNESSWPSACPVQKYTCLALSHPQLGMWPSRAYHLPQSSSTLFSRVWKSACWSRGSDWTSLWGVIKMMAILHV